MHGCTPVSSTILRNGIGQPRTSILRISNVVIVQTPPAIQAYPFPFNIPSSGSGFSYEAGFKHHRSFGISPARTPGRPYLFPLGPSTGPFLSQLDVDFSFFSYGQGIRLQLDGFVFFLELSQEGAYDVVFGTPFQYFSGSEVVHGSVERAFNGRFAFHFDEVGVHERELVGRAFSIRAEEFFARSDEHDGVSSHFHGFDGFVVHQVGSASHLRPSRRCLLHLLRRDVPAGSESLRCRRKKSRAGRHRAQKQNHPRRNGDADASVNPRVNLSTRGSFFSSDRAGLGSKGGESNRAHPTDPPFSFPFRTRRRGPIEPELDPVCPDGEGRGWPRSLRTS